MLIDLLALFLLFFGHFWVFAIVLFVGAILFENYFEIILFFLIFDLYSGTISYRMFGFLPMPFFFISILLYGFSVILRKKLRF